MKIQYAGLALLLVAAPGFLMGQLPQSATAKSFGVSIRTATINQTTPSAVLPGDGSLAQAQASEINVASSLSVHDAFAIATGEGSAPADAGSSATLGSVRILNGLITADAVVAMASSTPEGSSTEGSSIANLVVNGTTVTDPAPNTRVDLPGVGYVVLNEQTTTSGGVTVNMIHVVLQQPGLTGPRTTGEIIVGSASSQVN